VATALVKLMRNLCVHNPTVQALWRTSGTVDLVMATAGQGDAAYQRIIATFACNIAAGNDENRIHMSQYFPWSFVRWATIDVDVAFMVLQNMGSVAEKVLRGNPAFLYLFIALAAKSSQTKESEWVSIFFSSKSASFLEDCMRTIEGLDEVMLHPLQEAPGEFHHVLGDTCSKEETLRFLWTLTETLGMRVREDFVVRLMEQHMKEPPCISKDEASIGGEEEARRKANVDASCPSQSASSPFPYGPAPIWWGEFSRIVVARTADSLADDVERDDKWSGRMVMTFVLTRALPFLQELLNRRVTDPAEYVQLAQEWEVVSMLRIIGNVLLYEEGKEMVRDHLWMLLNHTFCDPDLPLFQEVGLFAVQNACRNCVPNQQRVYELTQTSSTGVAHMPDFVRAALDENGRLKRTED